MTILLVVLGYLVCCWLSYGLMLAYYVRRWPTLQPQEFDKDVSFSRSMSLFGPIALATFVFSLFCENPLNPFKYGFMFRR